MNKPETIEECQRYTHRSGDLYDRNTAPPWEPGNGEPGWDWRKTIFGDWFEREPNLPHCCDPSYERYWAM